MPKYQKFGLLPSPARPKDWRFGGLSGISNDEVLRADGQWDSYIPAYEPQSNVYFDTMSCVTFSAFNCIETLANRKYGVELNWSDRYTSKMSGTTAQGNGFANVGDSISNKKGHGLLPEIDWPFLPSIHDFHSYFSEVPSQLVVKAKLAYDAWDVGYEVVWDTPDSLMECLKYAPAQVGIHAYGPLTDGVYARTTLPGNHGVMLYGYVPGQYWKIYDHYDNKFKKLAWDTIYHGAFKYHIGKLTETPNMKAFKEGVLYQLVTPPGGFFLMAAGKLRKDDLSELLASWAVRNKGKTDGMTDVLTDKDLVGVDVYNLKNEKL